MSDDTSAPSLDELRGITDHIRFILDAKACAKRAEELIGLTIASQEAQAAAERSVVALDNRQAEIDAALAVQATGQADLDRRVDINLEWQKKLEAREKFLSEDGQRAYWLERIERAEKWENWAAGQVARISHLDAAYNSVLQSRPGLQGLVEEILSDHGIYADGASSEGSAPEEAVFQGGLAVRAPDVASGKPQRHGAERRV